MLHYQPSYATSTGNGDSASCINLLPLSLSTIPFRATKDAPYRPGPNVTVTITGQNMKCDELIVVKSAQSDLDECAIDETVCGIRKSCSLKISISDTNTCKYGCPCAGFNMSYIHANIMLIHYPSDTANMNICAIQISVN